MCIVLHCGEEWFQTAGVANPLECASRFHSDLSVRIALECGDERWHGAGIADFTESLGCGRPDGSGPVISKHAD